MMSLNTKAVITRTPTKSFPCGKKITAPATTPSVPTNVTVLGLTPSRRSRLPRGAQTLDQNWRNLSSMAASGYRVVGLLVPAEERRRDDGEDEHRHQAGADQPGSRGLGHQVEAGPDLGCGHDEGERGR